MDIEAEWPFWFEVFWTEKTNENIGPHHIDEDILSGKSHIEMIIPANKIYKIRFDFGHRPGKVAIKNIHLKGKTSISMDVSKFDYFSKDIQNHKIKDETLIIESDKDDPYTIYSEYVLIEK